MKKLMVILVAIAMVGVFTATSMAAEWNFYGHSRMTTFSYNKSKEVAGTNFDDQDTTWTSQTNARIGSKVKASDAVSGRFEMAMSSNNGGDTVGLRLMYGEWNFGSGSLLVGQDYTPGDTIISASAGVLPSKITGTTPIMDGEGNALQIGSMYTSRIPQIKLKFGAFQVALVQPSTVGSNATYSDIDTTIPKIEVAYTFKTDTFSVKPYAGYNTCDFANPATDASESVTSYIYGAQFGVNFGPMYVKGNVFGAQNSGNYGRSNVSNFDTATVAAGQVKDSTEYGGIILAGFKMNDMLTFEAGYAMDKTALEVVGASDSENDPSHWYINATITMAPGVFIVPEFGVFNFGDNEVAGVSTDQGDCSYFGAKWQINF